MKNIFILFIAIVAINSTSCQKEEQEKTGTFILNGSSVLYSAAMHASGANKTGRVGTLCLDFSYDRLTIFSSQNVTILKFNRISREFEGKRDYDRLFLNGNDLVSGPKMDETILLTIDGDISEIKEFLILHEVCGIR